MINLHGKCEKLIYLSIRCYIRLNIFSNIILWLNDSDKLVYCDPPRTRSHVLMELKLEPSNSHTKSKKTRLDFKNVEPRNGYVSISSVF